MSASETPKVGPQKATAVLLAEDDPNIYDVLLPYLQREGWSLIWVRSVNEALKRMNDREIDVVLIDRGLPRTSGDTLARKLAGGPVPFLMLTARSTESDRIGGFDLGADDYVTKPFSAAELVRRIQVVLRRRGAPHVWLAPELELDREGRLLRSHGRALPLTKIEFDLVSALASYPNRAFTRSELLERLGLDLETSERALDSHVKNIRRKLHEVGIDDELIRTISGVGYTLPRRS